MFVSGHFAQFIILHIVLSSLVFAELNDGDLDKELQAENARSFLQSAYLERLKHVYRGDSTDNGIFRQKLSPHNSKKQYYRRKWPDGSSLRNKKRPMEMGSFLSPSRLISIPRDDYQEVFSRMFQKYLTK